MELRIRWIPPICRKASIRVSLWSFDSTTLPAIRKNYGEFIYMLQVSLLLPDLDRSKEYLKTATETIDGIGRYRMSILHM